VEICDEIDCFWKQYKRSGNGTVKLLVCRTQVAETLAILLLDKLNRLRQRIQREYRGVQDLWLFRVEWYNDTVVVTGSNTCIFKKKEFMKKMDQLTNYIKSMFRK